MMDRATELDAAVEKQEEPSRLPAPREQASAYGPLQPWSTAKVVALQRASGNRAVVGLVGSGIQRQPQTTAQTSQPSTQDQLNDLKHRQDVLEKRQASTEQDLRWRATFGTRLSSWRQVILRVSAGLDTARAGFTQAQQDQAQFDAMVTQLWLAAASIGFAAGFEPLIMRRFGQGLEGDALEALQTKVEKFENPLVQAAGSASNLVPAVKNVTSPPASPSSSAPGIPGGSPTAFLAENLEKVESQSQKIEQAFASRANERQSATDDKILAFDPGAQDRVYQALDTQLSAVAQGIEKLKAPGEVATIIERHIWATWIKQNGKLRVAQDIAGGYDVPVTETPDEFEKQHHVSESSKYEVELGSYVEDRLNAVGVAAAAGVTLTGHWYSRNSPKNWAKMLITWAYSYNDTLGT